MTSIFDAWDNRKAERPDVAFSPTPASRDVTAYGAAALAGEVANLLAVPIGSGRNDQLNRSAVKLGGLVAAGALDANTVIETLGAADGGLDYKATRDTIMSGLNFGMQNARAIEDRGRPSTHVNGFDSGESDDPLSDSFLSDSTISTQQSTGSTPSFNPSGQSSLGDPLSDGFAGASGDTSNPARRSATTAASTPGFADDLNAVVFERLPIVDWFAAFDKPVDVEWIIEPLLPARRLVAIYSAPKVGKSLLMLELALAMARGTGVLGVTPERAYKVLYVDFENDVQGDIVPRLINMGADPTQLDFLKYLSLPSMAGFDTEKGGSQLLAAVQAYKCEVVVIDTVSRSVDGDENENDTWLKFYRQTGLRLKQAGIAMIRLDHTGKDETKGQRGGSAKGGDVDAVWRMSKIAEDHFRLDCDMSRFPIPAAEKILSLIRKEEPLRHVVDLTGDTIVELAIRACDDAGVPADAGWQRVAKLCAEAGIKVGQRRGLRIVAERKRRENSVHGTST